MIWLACGSLACTGVSYCTSGDMFGGHVGGLCIVVSIAGFFMCLMVVVSG